MTRYIVKRPKDTVEVLILPNKDGSGYQYINLTKGHICPCKFKTLFEAQFDMNKKMAKNNIVLVSEQTAPSDIKCIWEQEISRTIKFDSSKKVTEKLFLVE